MEEEKEEDDEDEERWCKGWCRAGGKQTVIDADTLARGGVSLSWRVCVKEMASRISIFIKTTDNLNVSCGKISQ